MPILHACVWVMTVLLPAQPSEPDLRHAPVHRGTWAVHVAQGTLWPECPSSAMAPVLGCVARLGHLLCGGGFPSDVGPGPAPSPLPGLLSPSRPLDTVTLQAPLCLRGADPSNEGSWCLVLLGTTLGVSELRNDEALPPSRAGPRSVLGCPSRGVSNPALFLSQGCLGFPHLLGLILAGCVYPGVCQFL